MLSFRLYNLTLKIKHMPLIKFIFVVITIIFWGRSAFYMLESALEIKAKQGISIFSLSLMSRTKLKDIYTETPIAKKYKEISNRNGLYFLACLLVIAIYQAY